MYGHHERMPVTDDFISQLPACARLEVPDAPAPSRLELQRQAAAYSAGLPALLGRAPAIQLAPELDDNDRRAIAALLPVLFDALTAIAGRAPGRAALAAIARIEIGAARNVALWKAAPDRLIVRAPWDAATAGTVAALGAAIEHAIADTMDDALDDAIDDAAVRDGER